MYKMNDYKQVNVICNQLLNVIENYIIVYRRGQKKGHYDSTRGGRQGGLSRLRKGL
jgi:hypothetical protein